MAWPTSAMRSKASNHTRWTSSSQSASRAISAVRRSRLGKTYLMDERIAQCGCGRLKVRVRGEPLGVLRCHCDFCQKQTGSAFRLSSFFLEDQVLEITGQPNVYNGLEI